MSLNFWDYLLFIIFIGVIFYLYCTWKYSYFKNSDVKYIKPWPLLGNMTRNIFLAEHITKMLERLQNNFADERYFGFFELRNPQIYIQDPEIIKQITVKDFNHFVDHVSITSEKMDPLFTNNLFALKGQKWKDMRMTLSPAFTSSKIKGMFPFIKECCINVITYLNNEIDKNTSTNKEYAVEVKDVFTRYTNDVIATTAFGLKVDSLKDKNNVFFSMGKKITNVSVLFFIKLILYMSFPKLMTWLRVSVTQSDVTDFFRNLVNDTMREREEKGIMRQDMIQLLMEAKKGSLKSDENTQDNEFTKDELSHHIVKPNWTDDEIAAQAFLFFLAGFDTTSTLLAFSAYQLACNQDVQKKLIDEVKELCENSDPSYENLIKMKYLDMFISECLRLWPSAPAVNRVCVKEYTLPPPNKSSNKKFKVNVNDTLIIPIRSIHRNPNFYKNPDIFDIERFSEENKSLIQPFTYLPFGLGPRQCIGNRFALIEIKCIIFYLISNFEIVKCSKTEDITKAKMKVTSMIPINGIWVGLKKRT